MSDHPAITAIETSDGAQPTARIWRQLQRQAEHSNLAAARTQASIQALTDEHFLALASQLKTQSAFGHDFDHGQGFFHRFMRAAGERRAAPDLHQIFASGRGQSLKPSTLTKVLSPGLLQRLMANRLQSARPPRESQRPDTAANARTPVGRPSRIAQRKDTAVHAKTPSAGRTRTLKNTLLEASGLWDLEPRYKLARQRRRRRRWGDMFTLTRPNGREPFYFDHSTTFYPLELKPPPDVDFIPFELYAALGVFVGWQWLVDHFVRLNFISDSQAQTALEIFLVDYRLLGVSPTANLQGAVAHYPSQEHMQRLLQYLSIGGRAKARMRVELLDRDGQTVGEAWVDFAVLRRTKDHR